MLNNNSVNASDVKQAILNAFTKAFEEEGFEDWQFVRNPNLPYPEVHGTHWSGDEFRRFAIGVDGEENKIHLYGWLTGDYIGYLDL